MAVRKTRIKTLKVGLVEASVSRFAFCLQKISPEQRIYNGMSIFSMDYLRKYGKGNIQETYVIHKRRNSEK